MPETGSGLPVAARPPLLLGAPTYVVAQLGRVARRLSQEAIAPRGLLLPHFSVLATLHDAGPLAQHELAARLGIHRSHLVGYVDELENRKAIRRQRDAQDRRRQVVSLTRAGERLLTQLREPMMQAQEQFLTGLSEQERARLMELLVRVLEHAGDLEAQAGARDPADAWD